MRVYPAGVRKSEIGHGKLVVISQEHHVFPVAADVLPLYHHIAGQTILRASHPLPALLNWGVPRDIGDRPAASLGASG